MPESICQHLREGTPCRLTHPERAGNRREHQNRISNWRQIDENGAIGKIVAQSCGDPEGKARLADASGTRQGDQPNIGSRQQ